MTINEITKSSTGGLPRLFVGFILGVGVVGLLFVAMQAMIKMSDFKGQKKDDFRITDYVEVKADITPPKTRNPPVKPPRPEPPPKQPAPPKIQNPSVQVNTLSVSAAPVEAVVSVNEAGFTTGAISDGSHLSVVKIAPIYPPRAQEKGLEGHCTVAYTVTKQGTTTNHRIDESDCSSRLFHKASINAAKKFKYKPSVRNGEMIDVPNVRNRFRYSLDD